MVRALDLQLMVMSSNPCIMAIFHFFSMTAAAIVDFKIFKFLTVGTFKRVKLHHRAKFRQNESNRGRNMAIFKFFKMAPPPSWIFEISNF